MLMCNRSRPVRTRSLTHPIVLGSALLIVTNDFVLRRLAPGAWTGKLSDVGWLVVVPVATAELLILARAPARAARPIALAFSAALYTALQLWPSVGSWFRADHVADPGDLLVLPALLGALYVWRTPCAKRVSAVLAWPLVLGALAADTYSSAPPRAECWPCGHGVPWNTAEPLRLDLEWIGKTWALDSFVRGMTISGPDDVDIPFVVAGLEDGTVAICAREGLLPDTAYVWKIGPWDDHPAGTVEEDAGLPKVTFVTNGAEGQPAADPDACAALVTEDMAYACGGARRDTRDAGDSGDTGDTGAPADTSGARAGGY